MTTEAHTPEPWTVHDGKADRGVGDQLVDEIWHDDEDHPNDPQLIATVWHGGDVECPKANSRLLLAAPKLLAALHQTLDIVEAECASDYLKIYRPGWARAIKKARAAIAKATD